MIPQAVYILFGAAFTMAAAWSLGMLILRAGGVRLFAQEETWLAFVPGCAVLSTIVFVLMCVSGGRKAVFLIVGLLILAWAWRRGVMAKSASADLPRFPPLPIWQRVLFGVPFAFFTVLYWANAMAPEMSPDGTTYHLGLVARYLRGHGFERITTNMYASLSEGVEMLYAFAFAFGKHSAAAMVHFSLTVTLAVLILCYGRRIGKPLAGIVASILVYASPVVGIDGTTAYIDAAVGTILFSVFYLVQIYLEERQAGLLAPIGLAAGFAFAAKYTSFLAIPYALVMVGWAARKLDRGKLKAVAVVAVCAFLVAVPWPAKNWIWMQNPLAPFFNAWFPNPYVHVLFEKEYRENMANYGLKDLKAIPWEVTVSGEHLTGFLGPAFLLVPLGLIALRRREGRHLLAAGLLFGATYFGNIGTRFLIPVAPFFALAMALVLAEWKALAVMIVLAHSVLSWPKITYKYAHNYAWRLQTIPWKAAIRKEKEADFLSRCWACAIAKMIDQNTPPGSTILAQNGVAESYTSRNILVQFQSAPTIVINDAIYTGFISDYAPIHHLTYAFAPQKLRKLRAVQLDKLVSPQQWSVSEFRVLSTGKEIPRSPEWRLRANPNPWDVQLAFDNSPVTRWRTWQAAQPGNFLEIDFGREVEADAVRLEISPDQNTKVRIEGADASGAWRVLSDKFELKIVEPPVELRRAAMREVRTHGIDYLLFAEGDFGAEDFLEDPEAWGVKFVAEKNRSRLYKILEPPLKGSHP
ncbi:MAG: glycosyltransferase family 39 protein [Bryobacteraceae bacterium]